MTPVDLPADRERTVTARPSPHLPYLPGLDGVRALAIIGVLFYHGVSSWLPGGFLGVTVFFVLSGYLITSLLLAEWQTRRQISLVGFWQRRARRLLPALYFLIVGTLTFAAFFHPHALATTRALALTSLVYCANWYLIFVHQSYFAVVGRPPLLGNLWSLAIEEQYYVVWAVCLRFLLPRGGWRWGAAIALLGVAASTILMATLYQPDADPSRLYYGTDTRAAELLLGSALAFVWVPARLRQERGTVTTYRTLSVLVDGLGLVALAILGWSMVHWNEFSPSLYHGGFLVVSLATAVLIAVLVHPAARWLPRVIGWRLFVWLGQRSYSVYLWYWPVFMVTRPQLDWPLGTEPTLVIRLALTFLLAEASYRFVETPFRRGLLGRYWRRLRELPRPERRRTLRTSALWGVLGLAGLSTLGVAVAMAQPAPEPSYLKIHTVVVMPSPTARATPRALVVLRTPTPLATPRPTAMPTSTPSASTFMVVPPEVSSLVHSQSSPPPAPTATVITAPIAVATATPLPTATPVPRPPLVTAVGDSVMLGAAADLVRDIPRLELNAQEGRQVAVALDVLRQFKKDDQLGQIIVIHIGNNGVFTAHEFVEMMELLGTERQVIVLNDKVPRPWEHPNNEMIAQEVPRYPNATLVNWYALSHNDPGLFWGDGIHLRPQGAFFYARLISHAVQEATLRLRSLVPLRDGSPTPALPPAP